MMAAPIFLGDEVTGAGYRLAGAHVATPAPGGETAALAEARAATTLVLVGASLATRIDARALEQAVSALEPLVVVVPDATSVAALPDLALRLRGQLGIEA